MVKKVVSAGNINSYAAISGHQNQQQYYDNGMSQDSQLISSD